MVDIIPINDSTDSRIAGFRNLNDAERRRDHAGVDGVVIGEGSLVIDRMLVSYCPPTQFLGTKTGLERLQAMPDFPQLPPSTPFYLADEATISECVGFAFNRHIFALAPRPEPCAVEEVLQGDPRTIVVLEGLNDHANIGSIFRNAAALGVDGVLMGGGSADPLYRRSVRVSMGHVLRIPYATCAGNFSTWQEPAFATLREVGYTIVALTPAHDAVHLREAAQAEKVAFIVGAEGPGLRPKTLAMADLRAQIPMMPGVDSLNVATSAAVAFYERARNN